MVSISDDAIRQYVGAILLGVVLGFVINHTYGGRISYHAAYMASHSEFYSSVEGAQRWLGFAETRHRAILAVSVGGSVLGAHTVLWKSRTIGAETDPARSYGKYVVGGFFGGLLFLLLGSIVAGIVHPLPSSYSAIESEILYRNNQLKLWITVSGIGLSALAMIGADRRQALSAVRAEQRGRFTAVQQRYRSLVGEFPEAESSDWPFVSSEAFADIESIQERADLVDSLESTVGRYEALVEGVTTVHAETASLPETDTIETEPIRRDVRRAIVRGETDTIDDLRERVEIERRRLDDRRRQNEIMTAAVEEHPTFVSERIEATLASTHVDTGGFDQKLDRCESYLSVSTTVQCIERRETAVDTDAMWELVDEVDPRSPEESGISIQSLADHLDRVSELLTFLESGNVEHLEIEPEEIVRSIDTAIATCSFEQITDMFERIESLRETTWSIETLQSMEWNAFEQLVGELWAAEGYETTVTQGSADEGIDVLAEDETTRIAIQAKRYGPGNKVGNRTVRNTAGVLPRGFDRVVVVTTSSFTRPAKQEAVDYGEQLRLVDDQELKQLLDVSDLVPPEESNSY